VDCGDASAAEPVEIVERPLGKCGRGGTQHEDSGD